jgi:hypothetical protein
MLFVKLIFLSCVLFLMNLSVLFAKINNNKQQYYAFLFIYASECPQCSYVNVKQKINKLKKKNIIPYLVVKQINPNQINNVKKYLNGEFNNCKILFDTNRYYSKKYRPKNDYEVIITDSQDSVVNRIATNENIIIKKKIIKNEVVINSDNIQINFNDDPPLNYYNNFLDLENDMLYIDDRVLKKIYLVDIITGKIINIINYNKKLEYIKDLVSKNIFNKIIENKLNRSRSLGFLKTKTKTKLLFMLMDSIYYNGQNLKPSYSYYIYNFIADSIKKLFHPRDYYLNSKNFLMERNNLYTGVYSHNYHHSNHQNIKYSSGVLAILKDNNFKILKYVNDLEEISHTMYSYSFLPELLFVDIQELLFYSPLNSLLFRINIQEPYKTIPYKVKGRLKSIFKELKNVDKFKIYEHQPFIYPLNIYSNGIKCYKKQVYILLMEKLKNTKNVYIQRYDKSGSMAKEVKLNNFNRNNDYLVSISLIGIAQDKLFFLTEWEKSFLEINVVPLIEL